MAFNIRPFKDVIALSKEKLDEAMAPIRARALRAKSAVVVAELDEKLVNLDRSIAEACADKDLDFDTVIGLIDKYELTERRRSQIGKLVAELFPEE